MAEQAQLETPLPPARRSKKLVATVASLAVLPLVLPVPFYLLEQMWIAPIIHKKALDCSSFCLAVVEWLQLPSLVIVGPSILVALASILLGVIGLIWLHLRPNAPNYIDTFMVSVILGILWLVLLSYVWFIVNILIYL